MSSYKEPPIVTAYGIQKDVTKPASFIDDSFDAPEVTIVGFCGKWDSARAQLHAWLLGDAGTGMKRIGGQVGALSAITRRCSARGMDLQFQSTLWTADHD